jgi:ATP-binding cassette subfamily A (ABC1) protein 3
MVGLDADLNEITKVMLSYDNTLKFKKFNSIDEVRTYVAAVAYGTLADTDKLCFGFTFAKTGDTYDFSLNYYDYIQINGRNNIPNNIRKSLDFFQTSPLFDDFAKYSSSGYLQMMRIINEYILRSVTNNKDASIQFGLVPNEFTSYVNDRFGSFLSFLVPFFIVIAYLYPLCIVVFRMVKEKEARAKEGMKIMGLSETVYFFSFFLQYLLTNTIWAIICSLILSRVFTHVAFIFLLAMFWLYGISVFAMGYFFQSLMDRTRIAMILSILLYFIFYFVSVAVVSDEVKQSYKMTISLLPPTAIQLGIQVLAKFEANGVKFNASYKDFQFSNYSINDMFLMLVIDILLYLFVGFYLQNVVTHQFGTKKPWYFLCTKGYWCKTRKVTSKVNQELGIMDQVVQINVSRDNNKLSADHFQEERNYEDKIKRGECLVIDGLRKEFDDGKIAVDGLNLNLYKDEIFALLGHNGAGKSTTINILSGLYEATGGKAFYKNMNIFENMNEFRRRIGICPQHDVLFDDLNVKEHLEMFCVFKGVPSEKIEVDVENIIREVELTDKAETMSKSLSGGQKRKLSIAIALVGGSEVVFLDEPSSGMDITSRRNLWDILKRCTTNRIIILTTHYMEEAAVLGKRIGILSNGKLKCSGNSLFLIDKFGKYISLSIMKESDAKDEEIINFIKNKVPNLKDHEELSEEILFRIPLTNDYSHKEFFSDLDNNLARLRIKSYGASMPTLEDVFLNVSAEVNNSYDKNKVINNNDPDSYDKYDARNEIKHGFFTKFFIDLKSSLLRRSIQIVRDKKTFVLEIICPIVLVLIGLAVSSVVFVKDSPSSVVNLDLLLNKTIIYINKQDQIFMADPKIDYQVLSGFDTSTSQTFTQTILQFDNKLTPTTNFTYDMTSFGSYYLLKSDPVNNQYEFVTLVNTYSKDSAIIFPQVLMNKIISNAAGREIKINLTNWPFPLTSRIRTQGQTRNNSNLVFFVSIAFALIPANFITLLIKEREQNTKHLQIVSGISYTSYWMSNFIFELIKYYFTGGICLLIILAFGFFPDWFWLVYLLYGFAMVSFTYMMTFVFKTEANAQNFIIMINFIFGALGGSVIMILRVFDDLKDIAQIIAYILRIIPSFAFAYGYNQLLNSILLFSVDGFVSSDIISLGYCGLDILYMGVEFFVYILILIILEYFYSRVQFGNKENSPDYTAIKDNDVKKEIEKSNYNDNSIHGSSKYSIRVQNLEKNYTTGTCCNATNFKAVNKLSFCLEYGECFALLGVNGAGKTTTFKCLTSELAPSKGKIFIDSLNLADNFDNVRSLIGYCPQFDAIFEYLTVKENLNFYANIRGIPSKKIEPIVNSLMNELNLEQYKDKVSGNLSGGNKRKLSVGIAMIGNPPIILLDEPSTGMDPEARRFMWAVIHKISKTRKQSSVILTTHSMEEAETLCRRMGIMVGGQFQCIGTSQQIKNVYGFGYEIDLRISNIPNEMLNQQRANLGKYILILDESVTMNNIQQVLNSINKTNFIALVQNKHLGREIHEEVNFELILRFQMEGLFPLEKYSTGCFI